MIDFNLVLITSLAFAAVAAMVFASGQYYVRHAQLRRRLPVATQIPGSADGPRQGRMQRLVTGHFGEERFGVDTALRSRLRRDLMRAGYFGSSALNYYLFARVCTVIVLPFAIFILLRVFLPAAPQPLVLLIVGVAALLGIFGPDAYLARRHRLLAEKYRRSFPDLLDLLVVCVSAGLSLEAAFDRVRGQIAKQNPALGTNLEMLGAEMRAGRGTIEGLNSLADRMGLDEAASFVAMLRQSVELGGDIGDALRIFSDEMRDKSLLRAEERANALSVKMVLPLGAFIFPVIMMIVMVPILIKLFRALY
jgi:tight adherence protein C